jgi:hypothetical protein
MVIPPLAQDALATTGRDVAKKYGSLPSKLHDGQGYLRLFRHWPLGRRQSRSYCFFRV